jgi:hypothetical protein
MNTGLFLQKLDTLKNRPLASLPALEAIQRWVLEFSDTLTTQRKFVYIKLMSPSVFGLNLDFHDARLIPVDLFVKKSLKHILII